MANTSNDGQIFEWRIGNGMILDTCFIKHPVRKQDRLDIRPRVPDLVAHLIVQLDRPVRRLDKHVVPRHTERYIPGRVLR